MKFSWLGLDWGGYVMNFEFKISKINPLPTPLHNIPSTDKAREQGGHDMTSSLKVMIPLSSLPTCLL